MKITGVDSSINLKLTFSREDVSNLSQIIKAMDVSVDTANAAFVKGLVWDINLDDVEKSREGLEFLLDILCRLREEIR